MTETTEQTIERDGFVDPSGRSRAFTLKYPVVVDGRTYSEIHLARLTVAEVAQFLETVSNADKRSAIAWPVYVDADGAPIPQAVLNALDDDDGFAIEQGLGDFLPLRLAALLDGATGRAPGEPTAPSSAA
jgi:hypothetical protein